MSSKETLPLGNRLRGRASQAFAKFQSIPPLVVLPAVGLAAWLATPYAIGLAEGRGPDVTTTADADETDGTATQRSDSVAQEPSSGSNASSTVGTVGGASLLARPITASTIPSWLPLPVPAPVSTAPASQPTPLHQMERNAAPPAPRSPKATGRLSEPMSQQRFADRQLSGDGLEQRRGSLMQSFNAVRTGRSAAIGNGLAQRGPFGSSYQARGGGASQWRVGGSGIARDSFGGGGYRGFGMGGFGGMRGGGGFRGGRR